MHLLNDPKTGFDFELQIRPILFTRIAQLLMDAGDLPHETKVKFGQMEIPIRVSARKHEKPLRNYQAFAGFAYKKVLKTAFQTKLLDFPDHPQTKDYLYGRFLLRTSLKSFNIYVRLPRILDMQAIGSDVRKDHENKTRTHFNLLDYVQVVSVQGYGSSDKFDPLDPEKGETPENRALRDMINLEIVKVGYGITSGFDYQDVLRFLRSQTDVLGPARIDKIYFKLLDRDRVLGVAFNLITLDHDRGYVTDRGDFSKMKKSYLRPTEEYSIATGPGIFRNLIADFLIKHVMTIRERLPANHPMRLTRRRVEHFLPGFHFPLDVPVEAVNSLPGLEVRLPNTASVKVVSISETVNEKRFRRGEQEVIHQSLGLTFALDIEDSGSEISANLELNCVPDFRDAGLFQKAEFVIDYDIQMDQDRALATGGLGKWLTTSIGAIYDTHSRDEEGRFELLDKTSLPFNKIDFSYKNWDALFSTSHQILLTAKSLLFARGRYGQTGTFALDRKRHPRIECFPREVVADKKGQIKALYYYSLAQGSELVDHFYATDRMDFRLVTDAGEPYLFSIPFSDKPDAMRARVKTDAVKLKVPFQPMARTMDEDDDRIAKLWIWSFNELLRARADFKKPAELQAHQRKPGTVRLAVTPRQLKELIDLQLILFPGFHPVGEGDELFFRGNKDGDTSNNLGNLPLHRDFVTPKKKPQPNPVP